MYGTEKHRGTRSTIWLDVIHIVIGVLIVVLAVLAFLNPKDNMLLFPLIFLLAAFLNLVNGIHQVKESGRDKKKKALGIWQLFLAIFLTAMAVVGAVSLWFG